MLDLQGWPVRWENTEHARAQVIHACRRASERYGFEFTADDYEKLRTRMIRQFESSIGIVHLKRQNLKKSWFAIWHGAEWLPIVYDKQMKTIVTFLPKNCLDRYRKRLPW